MSDAKATVTLQPVLATCPHGSPVFTPRLTGVVRARSALGLKAPLGTASDAIVLVADPPGSTSPPTCPTTHWESATKVRSKGSALLVAEGAYGESATGSDNGDLQAVTSAPKVRVT